MGPICLQKGAAKLYRSRSPRYSGILVRLVEFLVDGFANPTRVWKQDARQSHHHQQNTQPPSFNGCSGKYIVPYKELAGDADGETNPALKACYEAARLLSRCITFLNRHGAIPHTGHPRCCAAMRTS